MTKKLWSENTVCNVCNQKLISMSQHPYREYDENGNWTGRWLCFRCYYKCPKKNDSNSDLKYYKSYRFIEEKVRLVVTDEYNNIIKNPTKEQIENAKFDNRMNYRGVDHKDTICCLCGTNETYIKKDGNPDWRPYKGLDYKEEWNGKSYTCKKCYGRIVQNLPDSQNNIRKRLANSRNKQLDPDSGPGKGFIGEQIVANTLGIKNCNLDRDNFNYQIDLYDDIKYKKIQVKYTALNRDGEWFVQNYDGNYFDHLFIVCMSKDYKKVERVYIIPWCEAIKRKSITIIEKMKKTWYNLYMVDEKPYNDTYCNMNLDDCPVLRKRKKKNK